MGICGETESEPTWREKMIECEQKLLKMSDVKEEIKSHFTEIEMEGVPL